MLGRRLLALFAVVRSRDFPPSVYRFWPGSRTWIMDVMDALKLKYQLLTTNCFEEFCLPLLQFSYGFSYLPNRVGANFEQLNVWKKPMTTRTAVYLHIWYPLGIYRFRLGIPA